MQNEIIDAIIEQHGEVRFDFEPKGSVAGLEQMKVILHRAQKEDVTLYEVCPYGSGIPSEVIITRDSRLEHADTNTGWRVANVRGQYGNNAFYLGDFNVSSKDRVNYNFIFTDLKSAEEYSDFCKTDASVREHLAAWSAKCDEDDRRYEREERYYRYDD